MSRRTVWRVLFLGVTGLALGMEVWASADSDPATEPWTDLIVAGFPAELTTFFIGGVTLWLREHFKIRYERKAARGGELPS